MTGAPVIYLDFETYYDQGYSLQNLPTAQYVRDERFQALGAAVAAGHGHPAWLTFDESGDGLDVLRTAIPGAVVVAHNAAFDAAVLDRLLPGVTPALWLCTMNWTRYAISQGALPPDARTGLAWWGSFLEYRKGDTAAAVAAGGQQLATYAERDIELLRRVFAWLRKVCPWPLHECRASDLHVRMAANPVLELDTPLLESLATGPLPEAEALRSRDTFAAVLRKCGVEPGTKQGARGRPTYAFAKTDPFMQSLARHPDPRVRKLRELKTMGGSTIEATRAQRFLDVGSPLPAPLWYYGAHTGRASGADGLNMQNLPSGPLRRALRAPDGHVLVVADYSQIEARVIAWGADCAGALGPFVSGRDPYKEAATAIFHVDYDEVSPLQRDQAKAAVLALGFGQSANGFLGYCQGYQIDMDERTANWIVSVFRRQRPALVAFWRTMFERLLRDGHLKLPSGRLLTYPDMQRQGRDVKYWRHHLFSRGAGRQAVNLWPRLVAQNWTQAVARDVSYHAALRMPGRPALLVHDEVVLVVPRDAGGHVTIEEQVSSVMLDLPEWAAGLPVDCEVTVMETYGGNP